MEEKRNGKIARILLVDDSAADMTLNEEALKAGDILHTIDKVGDGVEALSFLKKEGKYFSASRPDLIRRERSAALTPLQTAFWGTYWS